MRTRARGALSPPGSTARPRPHLDLPTLGPVGEGLPTARGGGRLLRPTVTDRAASGEDRHPVGTFPAPLPRPDMTTGDTLRRSRQTACHPAPGRPDP